jgi:hypothetical protein
MSVLRRRGTGLKLALDASGEIVQLIRVIHGL